MAMRIRVDSYFDGEQYRRNGPVFIEVEEGVIAGVHPAAEGIKADLTAAFAMPGLVEAHAHIFLDGAELDPSVRSAYLSADFPSMMETARENASKSARAGVTLIRDAGDRYGVNHAMRAELAQNPNSLVRLRSPSLGIKRPKRYGAFMARDIKHSAEIPAAIAELASCSDDIKIILTGVIDFKASTVKGEPQFSGEELARIVSEACRHGRRTFAHCSGVDGLEVAVSGGVDSIEHGFFMTRDVLVRMVDKGIAWVPTFSPVHFQWACPEIVGWDAATVANLRRILDQHYEHVAMAADMGVMLVAGSDAGSPGVDHGIALIDELFHFLRAGVPMAEVLRSATSRPRELWCEPSANIAKGNRAELVLYAQSPFEAPETLRQPQTVVVGEMPSCALLPA